LSGARRTAAGNAGAKSEKSPESQNNGKKSRNGRPRERPNELPNAGSVKKSKRRRPRRRFGGLEKPGERQISRQSIFSKKRPNRRTSKGKTRREGLPGALASGLRGVGSIAPEKGGFEPLKHTIGEKRMSRNARGREKRSGKPLDEKILVILFG
jgi:hypothetical protein